MKKIKGPLLAATSAVMLAMAMGSSAQAIPFRDDVGDEGAQEFAQGWDGVVQIYLWNRVTGGIGFNCTGSMINARTVISAAHCFDANPEQVYADAPGSLTPIIAFGPDTFVPLFNWINTNQQFVDDLNGLTFGVDLMMHPDSEVNGVNTFPAADVAMIALANPLYTLPTYGMLFSPIPEDVFNEGVLVNQIGYGTFHPGSDNDAGSINGRRRAGENMLGLMASQSDFFQALAGENAGSPVPSDNQLLYWTDFDLPGRTGTCVRANLGATAEDSIFCDDNVPGDGVRLDGDTVILPGPSIDYFPGDALPNEAATGGGDSGGPLMAMNLFNNPLLLGVLSGGFVDGFFTPLGPELWRGELLQSAFHLPPVDQRK
ncbi:trypsin-like serine protease [Oceanicaulis sp.]|uniref:trypsin-like serine protease n=1 Tax=Oceanicaulis sp. TaxID=1924941 RepID=UPI003D290200